MFIGSSDLGNSKWVRKIKSAFEIFKLMMPCGNGHGGFYQFAFASTLKLTATSTVLCYDEGEILWKQRLNIKGKKYWKKDLNITVHIFEEPRACHCDFH